MDSLDDSQPDPTAASQADDGYPRSPFANHAPQDLRWYVRIPDGREYGPVDRATLLEWYRAGRVDVDCQLRTDATRPWSDAQPVLQALQPSADAPGEAVSATADTNPADARSQFWYGLTVFLLAVLGVVSCVPLFSAGAWRWSAVRLTSPVPLTPASEKLLRAARTLAILHTGFSIAALVAILFVLLLQFFSAA